MAAYAALVSLINNMEQIMKHPRLSNCFDGEQMESLLQNAGSLLDFIEGGHNHEDLERKITSAARAAENVVESHVVDQIHAGTLGSLDLQQVIQDMGAVAGKALEVKEREGVREKLEEKPPITYPTAHMESGSGTAMVGLDDELTQLLDMLTDHHSNRHVISIVGMGGTGKTTLAQNLYAHQLVKEHFDIRAWATISQQYDSKDILSRLLSCQGKFTEGNVDELGQQLHKTLYGKRYLIVLDDVWGVEAWDRVRLYLPDSGNRSRVVLTTRLSNIANDCGLTCFDLNLLDEDKSWGLFCNKAMFPLKHGPPQLENVAKKIVKSCKGLALSIVVIGGLLLKSPRSVRYWEGVSQGLRYSNDFKEKQRGLAALFLSYKHLPPHLKPCFLYLGVFKEDSRICVSNITKLWVAEGFIKPKGSRVLEDIAEDYLKDLSDRNLVLGLEHRFSGKIKSFSIHDLLRDLSINLGKQQKFFHIGKPNKRQDNRTVRRLVYATAKKTIGDALARSILGQNYNHEYVKHGLPRVYDGSDYWNEHLYGNSVNLRYLVKRVLSVDVCLVWNLQTLIIENSNWNRLVVAPLGIWKMRQLRHFKCDQVYLPDPPPRDGQDCLENLQTLKTAVNLRLSEEACEMIPNIKKLHLLYDFERQGYDDSLIECLPNLDRFHKLESLDMEIMTSKWPNRDPELILKLAFPCSLKKLCLSHCCLSWEDMSVVGSLPQLQVLHLNHHAVKVARDLWSPVDGQFLCLKLLKIERCGLSSWDAYSSHFPVLEKLLLRYLFDLEEIPLDFGEIPTLRLIRVDCCGESAPISAMKIKKDQLENYDDDALQIELVVYPSDRKSFKRRVEEVELAIDQFKLEMK